MSVVESYSILGLNTNATLEEVKASHRRLIKKIHPDLFLNNPDALTKAEEITKKINLAVEDIKNHLSNINTDIKYEINNNRNSKIYSNTTYKADYKFQKAYDVETDNHLISRLFGTFNNCLNLLSSQSYRMAGVFGIYFFIQKYAPYRIALSFDINLVSNFVCKFLNF